MSATTAFIRTWPVERYTATLTMPMRPIGAACMTIEWEPRMPRRLTRDELRQYQAGRDTALSEWARLTGHNIGLI